MSKAQATEIREAEQRRASSVTGAAEVIFLRLPDGMLEATLDIRRRLVREIRRFRPEVVVAGDPTIGWAGRDSFQQPAARGKERECGDFYRVVTLVSDGDWENPRGLVTAKWCAREEATRKSARHRVA